MKKKSWLVRYFTYYLVIGVLPVIVLGCIFYYMNVIELNKDVRNNNYSALTQSLSKLDYLVEKMNNISYHLSGYQFENDIQYKKFENFSITDDSIISQRLKTYEETLGIPVQAMLYIRGDIHIYTSEAKYRYSIFEEDVQEHGDLTMSKFYTIISSIRHNTSMRVSNNFYERQHGGGLMVYLYPIPYMDVIPSATLGFMFRDKDIQNVIENYLGDIKGNAYIYNEYLQEVFRDEEIRLEEEVKEEYVGMKGTGVFEQNIDSDDYIVMRDVSQNSGFSIVVVAKEKDFYSRVNLMQMMITLLVVFLLVVALIQAIMMSRRSYRPIKKLVQAVGGGIHSNNRKYVTNEFDLIENHWENIENKNQELHYLVDRQRPMVVYSCLSELLKGKIVTAEALDFSLKCANINLSSPFVFVMLVAPINQNLGDKVSYTHSIISTFEEVILSHGRLYGLELISENKVAVISNFDKKEIDGQEIRIWIARKIQKNLMVNFGIKVQIGVGRVYENILQINASFMEAMVVFSDYFPMSKIDIALFEDVAEVVAAGQGGSNFQYPVIEQALYIQSIKQADEAIALKALADMISKISKMGSFLIIQCLCYDIINMIIKTANQLNNKLKFVDIKSLCSFNDLDEFKKNVSEFTIQICRQYEQFKEKENSEMKAKMINYVNDNFCDPNMSLGGMANHFGISPNYLSRLFKQETGCNFTQYITMLRMDRVKNQLIHTDHQIKDIVAQVGYLDVASFNRKFKSQEGITPSQYREQMRRNL